MAEKITVTGFRIEDSDGVEYRLSSEDDNGDPLEDGEFRLTDYAQNTVQVSASALRLALRAAEAALTGVLLEDTK